MIDRENFCTELDAVITDLFCLSATAAITANRDLNAPLAEYAEQIFDLASRLHDLVAQFQYHEDVT